MDRTQIDRSDWTVEDYIEDMRHHGETIRIMQRMKLNVMITTMVHYDLPWLTQYKMSDDLDLLAIQQALLEHGPSPVLVRKAQQKGDCRECGGTGDSHYLSCSIWPHNHKAA